MAADCRWPIFCYKPADFAAGQTADGRGITMAAHGHDSVELGTAATVDFASHERTYRGFLALFKYGTIAVAVVLILMAIFLL